MRKFKNVGGRVKLRLPKLQTEYYDQLIKHWKQKIDSSDFINLLKNKSISFEDC